MLSLGFPDVNSLACVKKSYNIVNLITLGCVGEIVACICDNSD